MKSEEGGTRRSHRRVSRNDEFERRRRLMNEVIEEITANGGGLRIADNLPREAYYERAALR